MMENVKGLPDVKQACLDIENKINDSISPQPNYTLEIQNNDQMIKLTVTSGFQKPYLYKSKAYKRNDTATIRGRYSGIFKTCIRRQKY